MAASTPERTYVHLHLHTEHSDLDGMSHVKDVVSRAAADGQPAVAATDHGSLAASWEMVAEARKAGIKPILGIEAYAAAAGTRAKPKPRPWGDGSKVSNLYEHMTILARTAQGWSNLLAIHEAAQHTKLGKHPLIDMDLIAEHGEGLIMLTGCLAGPVSGALKNDAPDVARASVQRMIDAVGKENVYVEVMDHDVEDEDGIAEQLVDLAREFDLPIVATNDSHYTDESDAEAHEAWLAIQTQDNLLTPREKRFSFNGHGYWVRTTEEMYAVRDEDWWAEACANTVALAERVEDDVMGIDGHLRLPEFPLDDDCESAQQHFDHLVTEGAKRKYGTPLPAEAKERLRYERSIISGMGMVSYFLIVADMIAWARAQGIAVGPGRGSAAGSATSYCLDIVRVDPIRGGLLFERFLDPTRVGMPDIDSDFEKGRREEVLRYLTHKYGSDYVARIGTLQVAASRGALKRANQALGLPTFVGDRLSKAVPLDGATPYSFAKIRAERNEAGFSFFKAGAELGDDGKAVVRLAARFESVAMGKSIHACGVVIGDEPLTGLVPLRRETKADPDDPSITEWEAAGVEGAGLLKLDVLGLRNLDVVAAAVRNIEALTGEVVDIDNLPDPDDTANPRVRAAYDMLASGNTSGVFQLDSEGMTDLTVKVRPSCLEDLSALLALYRPGPMSVGAHDAFARRKAGLEPVSYTQFTTDPAETEVIDGVLGNTKAALTYQEQVMFLAEKISGFDAAQKSTLRKAFSKKDMEKMQSLKGLFFDGGTSGAGERGVKFAKRTLEALWVAFEGSASYLFNKSHSYAYGFLSYTTAYLKANWPAPYGAAMLSVTKEASRRGLMLASLRSGGITVLVPDVNTAGFSTSATSDTAITLGLSEIRDVGETARAIVEEREANGPFTSLGDLARRVRYDDKRLSATVLTALASSGACDEFGPRKGQARIARIVTDAPTVQPAAEEWGVVERAVRAHRYLGVFVGDHPMSAIQDQVKKFEMSTLVGDDFDGPRLRAVPVESIRKVHDSDRKVVYTVGMVTGATAKTLKSGPAVFGTLEGANIAIDFATFRAEEGTVASLTNGQVVAVKARRGHRTVTETDDEGNEVERSVARLVVDEVQAVPFTDAHAVVEKRPLGLDLSLLGTARPAPQEPTKPTKTATPRARARGGSAKNASPTPDHTAKDRDPDREPAMAAAAAAPETSGFGAGPHPVPAGGGRVTHVEVGRHFALGA